MPDIRYVCLSDMHMGAANSLLTNLTPDCSDTDPATASPVLVQLVTCLRTLIDQNENKDRKPTLILNGDILELALTTDNEAAMVFERFIELIFPAEGERLFDKEIVYIPGNHDHHLWETAREVQYAQYMQTKKPGSVLNVPWHATNMFDPDAVPSLFLNGIIRRYKHLADVNVKTVYPNYALLKDDRRCAIFSHGHFIESLYTLMTTLRAMIFPKTQRPVMAWDIEAENFAWIDFFWSTLGRSGDVGTDVEIVYDKLQSPAAIEQMADNLAEGLAARYKFSPLGDWIEAKVLKQLVHFLLFNVAHVERQQPESLMSADAQAGLKTYLEGPVLKQIQTERNDNIPRDVTFIFGHTHKPYEEDLDFQGYHRSVSVLNTGGWVVDTLERQPLHGGAIVVLDEDLYAVSLRMYNENVAPDQYGVTVEMATHSDAEPNPLHARITQLVKAAEDPWKTFSAAVAGAVPLRERNLRLHIE